MRIYKGADRETLEKVKKKLLNVLNVLLEL